MVRSSGVRACAGSAGSPTTRRHRPAGPSSFAAPPGTRAGPRVAAVVEDLGEHLGAKAGGQPARDAADFDRLTLPADRGSGRRADDARLVGPSVRTKGKNARPRRCRGIAVRCQWLATHADPAASRVADRWAFQRGPADVHAAVRSGRQHPVERAGPSRRCHRRPSRSQADATSTRPVRPRTTPGARRDGRRERAARHRRHVGPARDEVRSGARRGPRGPLSDR